MRGLIFSLVAVALLLVATGEASAFGGRVVVRRTPFRPFVGPVVVNRGFAPRGVVVSPGLHSRGFVSPGYGGFNRGLVIVGFDQFGNPIFR